MKLSKFLRLAVVSLYPFGFLAADDQPQWGERFSRNMVSSETGLPDRFDPRTGENIRWTTDLGTQSYSTPVVARGLVLIGTNNGRPRDPRHRGDRGVLMCFRERDGRFLWQLVVPKLSEDRFLDWPGVGMTSPATVDGGRIFMVTNRAEVVCLDPEGLADGNDGPYKDEGRHMTPQGEKPLTPGPTDADIIWLFDMRAELGVHPHDSAHCSILVDGDFLYVCTSNGVDRTHLHIPNPNAPSLIVLEKRTGRLLATDAAGIGPNIVHCMWSSPSLGVVDGKRLVFFGGGDGIVYAFEALKPPARAQAVKLVPVWRFDCDPTGPRGDLPRWQENREEGPSNISGMPVFHRGRVYVTAGGDVWHGKTKSWLFSIRAGGFPIKHGATLDITTMAKVWSYPLKLHCLSTPAVWNDLVFITDTGRMLHCLDVKTGRPHWTQRLRGTVWASPLVADGKVYIGTRGGGFWIFRASAKKEILSSVRLGAPVSGTATAANGVLYVATMKRLFAVAASESAGK